MSDSSQGPKHIAIVMDGNGRWAKARNKPRVFGHQAGVESVRKVIQACIDKRVPILSLFAFSSENWSRPALEVKALMELFSRAIARESAQLHDNHVRCEFIGDLSQFNQKLQNAMYDLMTLTKDNTGLQLNVAVNYGGRWDITQACRQIARLVQDKQLAIEEIDEAIVNQHLSTHTLPPPDLFIRTSGEQRLSNFFLWQSAYSELYFTDTYWPDFDEAALELALVEYAKRTRRFGHTDEQLES